MDSFPRDRFADRAGRANRPTRPARPAARCKPVAGPGRPSDRTCRERVRGPFTTYDAEAGARASSRRRAIGPPSKNGRRCRGGRRCSVRSEIQPGGNPDPSLGSTRAAGPTRALLGPPCPTWSHRCALPWSQGARTADAANPTNRSGRLAVVNARRPCHRGGPLLLVVDVECQLSCRHSDPES